MQTIIADTSALYALVDADDAHHAEAVAFLKPTGKRLTLVVPETTLFETPLVIKSRLSQGTATPTLTAMQASRRYRIISLTEPDRKETWRIFSELRIQTGALLTAPVWQSSVLEKSTKRLLLMYISIKWQATI